MTPEKLNEQQGFLVNQLIASHEVEIKHEKNASFAAGCFLAFVVFVLIQAALYALGVIPFCGGCK